MPRYYYDNDVALYYLGTRYYDQNTHRFLSPDNEGVISATPGALTDKNLYSYCDNNPVMYEQHSGSYGAVTNSISGLTSNTMSDGNANGLARHYRYQNQLNFLGYEVRASAGWNDSIYMLSCWFGRIGFSSYTTHTQGSSGMLYAFIGSTTDVMNWFGTTYYVGAGINLYDVIGVEYQLEMLGLSTQVNIGNFSISLDRNLIGSTSLTFAKNLVLENGLTKTSGFTISANTGCLAAVIVWLYKAVTTGDISPIPALQP